MVEFSPVLVTRFVSVQGVPPVDVPTVVRRAAVPMGTPLAKVDTRAIALRVIATPALAEVTVTRWWPSTIVISARQRVPVLAVRDPQGQVQVVDSGGDAYATVSAPPQGVPLVSTAESPPSVESLRAVVSVLQALPSARRGLVTDVTVQGPNMVTFRLGAVTVMWGGASEPELKVQVMTALLRLKGAGTIDVSAPHNPVTR